MDLSPAGQTASPANGDRVSHLQQQVEYHQRMIYELRSQINQCAAISRLPAEMLCRIFQFTRDACKVPSTSRKNSEELAWIVLTHVCRRWRNLALDDHGLWARVSLQFPKWTTEMLQRSQTAGLSVTILNLPIVRNIHTPKIFAQSHRFVQLTFRNNGVYPEMGRILHALGPLHLPSLKKLCLVLGTRHQSPRLPDNLFQGTVQLRHLELWGVDISWDSPLFNGLTTLVLENMPSKLPSWLQLCTVLRGMPELRSLTIRDILPSKTPESTLIKSPVHLPCLRKLCINDDAKQCKMFYDIVLFDGCLDMTECLFRYGEPDDLNVGDIRELLSSADCHASGNCLSASAQRLEIGGRLYTPYHSFNMSLLASYGSLDLSMLKYKRYWPNEDLLWIVVQILEPGSREDISDMLFKEMFHVFHFQTLLELDISSLKVFKPFRLDFCKILAATFGNLPRLYSVCMGYEHAPFLIDLISNRSLMQDSCIAAGDSKAVPSILSDKNEDLDENLGPTSTPSSISVTFPALRNLRLRDVTFAGGDCDISLSLLKKCLISRRECDVSIRILALEDCRRISAEDVAELRDLVPHVDWDGEGADDSETEEDSE